jgi:hypothetical protein
MSREMGEVIVTKNEDGTGTITAIATDGTTKTERFDAFTPEAQATEKAIQRVQDA